MKLPGNYPFYKRCNGSLANVSTIPMILQYCKSNKINIFAEFTASNKTRSTAWRRMDVLEERHQSLLVHSNCFLKNCSKNINNGTKNK